MSTVIFDCKGKVNINDWQLNNANFLFQKELDAVLRENKPCIEPTIKVFGCELSAIDILLNLKHFVICIDAKLKQLSRYEKVKSKVFGASTISDGEEELFSIRQTVCGLLIYLRGYIRSMKDGQFTLNNLHDEAEKDFDDLISTIQRFLNRMKNISDSDFNYAISVVGNKCNQPDYHLCHIHLDLRWLLLSLLYAQNNSSDYTTNNFENLENLIYKVVGDLIYISMKVFTLYSNSELKTKTPYSCTCVRELWVMLQIFIDDLHKQNKCKIFWHYVNTTLKQLFASESNNDLSALQRTTSLPNCKNSELFCLWIIHHLTLLYGYSENGVYCNGPSNRFLDTQDKSNLNEVEKILKAYVNKGAKDGNRDEIDEELNIIIPLLHTLSFEWWTPNVQIITLLWDCFHRRLDQPFLLQTRGPWSTSSEKKNPMEILDIVKNRMKYSNEISNESSFGLFLRYLGSFLQKHYNRSDLKIWNQLKGRIFSRFSQNKIQEFSECGLYNFISLFLTLAVTADTINVCSVLLNLLPPVTDWTDSASGKKCCLAWKSKLSVLLLYKEQNFSFKDIAEQFTETANAVSCRKDEFSQSMMTWFIDVLRMILMHSEHFDHFQHNFLGGWIDRYLYESAPNKVGVLTHTLLKVFEKCNSDVMGSTLMINALWNHVASRIRQMATTCDLSTDFYENPTKLAVAFTLEACRDPETAKKYRHTAVSLFQHFTTSIIIKDIRITRLYLTLILQNDSAVQYLKKDINNFNTSCMQAWLKCNILNFETSNETDFLKNYIINFTEVKEILNTDTDIAEFLNSHETIISFLMIIARKRSALKAEQQIIHFDNLCRPFFLNIDKWVLQHLNQENKDSKLSLWIYRCIGTIIFCCSPILYIKNQPNILKSLITKIALPSDQTKQNYLMILTQRIFSMLVLSLDNLNIKYDISLQTLLRELFEKYLPLLVNVESITENRFKVADTLTKCFLEANINYVRSVLEMLVCNFIIIPGGNSTHKNCYLVMLLLRNIVKAGKLYSNEILELITSICIPSIIKCYLKVHEHHPHRHQTMDILRDISLNPYYKENSSNLRQKLNEVIWVVLEKNISSNSKASFEFFNYVFKVNMEFFKHFYPRTERIVLECEKNKLPNAAALRYSLNNLKRCIDLHKSKS